MCSFLKETPWNSQDGCYLEGGQLGLHRVFSWLGLGAEGEAVLRHQRGERSEWYLLQSSAYQ